MVSPVPLPPSRNDWGISEPLIITWFVAGGGRVRGGKRVTDHEELLEIGGSNIDGALDREAVRTLNDLNGAVLGNVRVANDFQLILLVVTRPALDQAAGGHLVDHDRVVARPADQAGFFGERGIVDDNVAVKPRGIGDAAVNNANRTRPGA